MHLFHKTRPGLLADGTEKVALSIGADRQRVGGWLLVFVVTLSIRCATAIESVVTGPGNALGDVVVYISAGAPAAAAASTPAVFDQKGCQYIPHVLALQAGQKLEIRNDDQTSHNIHPMSKVNPEWNKRDTALLDESK